jgi:hypothetical protein
MANGKAQLTQGRILGEAGALARVDVKRVRLKA